MRIFIALLFFVMLVIPPWNVLWIPVDLSDQRFQETTFDWFHAIGYEHEVLERTIAWDGVSSNGQPAGGKVGMRGYPQVHYLLLLAEIGALGSILYVIYRIKIYLRKR